MQPSHGEASAGSPRRRRSRWLAHLMGVALSALLGCALPPAATPEEPALAESEQQLRAARAFSDAQHQQLRERGRVEESVELERRGQRYVGGVSYVLVDADPGQVFDALNRLDTL